MSQSATGNMAGMHGIVAGGVRLDVAMGTTGAGAGRVSTDSSESHAWGKKFDANARGWVEGDAKTADTAQKLNYVTSTDGMKTAAVRAGAEGEELLTGENTGVGGLTAAAAVATGVLYGLDKKFNPETAPKTGMGKDGPASPLNTGVDADGKPYANPVMEKTGKGGVFGAVLWDSAEKGWERLASGPVTPRESPSQSFSDSRNTSTDGGNDHQPNNTKHSPTDHGSSFDSTKDTITQTQGQIKPVEQAALFETTRPSPTFEGAGHSRVSGMFSTVVEGASKVPFIGKALVGVGIAGAVAQASEGDYAGAALTTAQTFDPTFATTVAPMGYEIGRDIAKWQNSQSVVDGANGGGWNPPPSSWNSAAISEISQLLDRVNGPIPYPTGGSGGSSPMQDAVMQQIRGSVNDVEGQVANLAERVEESSGR